jgi:Fe-S-cluster containining protein
MHKQCILCNARCCRYFCFQIDAPRTYEQFEQVRWYLTHQGIRVHVDPDGAWWIFIDNRCRWLEETVAGPRCASYDNRPLICRRFSPRTCDFARGPYQAAIEFETADQLEAHAREVLGPERFDAERARFRSPRRRQSARRK